MSGRTVARLALGGMKTGVHQGLARGYLAAQGLSFSSWEILAHSQHRGYQDQEQAIAAGCPMGFPWVPGCEPVKKLNYYYYY